MCLGNAVYYQGKGKRRCTLIAIAALAILFTNGFSYVHWNQTLGGWIRNLLSYGLLAYLLFGKRSLRRYNFRTEIMLLMLIPFLSIINSWSVYSQSPFRSFTVLLGQFAWVIYFLLHKYRVSEKTVLLSFLYISLFIVSVQIIQQFTYPDASFGIMSEDVMIEKMAKEAAEQRNGLWRFRMHSNAYFTAPILFALWLKLRARLNFQLVLLVALLFASVYLTLTRQVMVACMLAIFLSSFMGKTKINMSVLFLGLVLIGGLYIYYDVLFSSLAEQTHDESNEDNVRLLAASTLWNESLRNPLTFLFGYGLPDPSSQYSAHMTFLKDFFGIYTSDVGFIGQIFERGFIYVCVSYCLLWKLFFGLKRLIPVYVRMFVLFAGAMSIMIFPFMSTTQTLVWAMLLYVCDLHINKSRLAIENK